MTKASIQCRRFLIQGQVQGVFYRASTQSEAAQHDLTGWVRNRDDGRVEVLACGSNAGLDALETWLHEGPPRAVVASVTSEPADDPGMSGFEII